MKKSITLSYTAVTSVKSGIRRRIKLFYSHLFLLGLCLFSCNDGFLQIKPDKALVIPKTIENYQALLDNETTMNAGVPSLGELSCDDYYTTHAVWASLVPIQKDGYIWSKELILPNSTDWSERYRAIYYANVILEGISTLKPDANQQEAFNHVKGSALFYRARSLYHLSTVFMASYNPGKASTELGLVLKLSPDVKETYSRSSMQETYDQMIRDLEDSLPLLPATPLYKTRPSKTAAHALLSNIFLSMGFYEQSLDHASKALSFYNELIDYNTLDTNSTRPFVKLNKEVLFDETMSFLTVFLDPRRVVDSILYASYDNNDLRKQLFFRNTNGTINFKGQYSGGLSLFSGLTPPELYLNRAECYARSNNLSAALNDLNHLLKSRWKTGTFTPISTQNTEEALTKILEERRKELVFRGKRWRDIKRLNLDPRFSKTLYREIDGETYSLPPDDPRYVIPIPENEIQISGIEQNIR